MAETPRGLTILSFVLGAVFLIVALLPLGIGAWLYARASDFTSTAAQTSGTIVDIHASTDSDRTTYKPEFEYTDAAGDTHRVVSSWSSNPPAYHVGDPVQVLYDPKTPSYGQIKSIWVQWIGPIISFSCAGVPLALAALFLVVVPLIIKIVAARAQS